MPRRPRALALLCLWLWLVFSPALLARGSFSYVSVRVGGTEDGGLWFGCLPAAFSTADASRLGAPMTLAQAEPAATCTAELMTPAGGRTWPFRGASVLTTEGVCESSFKASAVCATRRSCSPPLPPQTLRTTAPHTPHDNGRPQP